VQREAKYHQEIQKDPFSIQNTAMTLTADLKNVEVENPGMFYMVS